VSAAGNSSTVRNYSYVDAISVTNTIYYRLRQVDADGTFTYTPVRILKGNAGNEVMVHATSDRVIVHFTKQVRGTVALNVMTSGGQIVTQKKVQDPVGETSFSCSSVNTGIYIVQITDGNLLQVAKKISIIR
jgi:hypothetical protein